MLSTTYFGWHYIADDIAGAVIAFISFYLGGIATGQKFDEHGRHSHPTTTTSDVPVEATEDDARTAAPELASLLVDGRPPTQVLEGLVGLLWRSVRGITDCHCQGDTRITSVVVL